MKSATEVLPLVPVTATTVPGCGRVEARRHEREAAARIGVLDHPHRRMPRGQRGEGGGIGDQHGGRAFCHGLVDEAAAVGARAGQGGEEKARLDRTRIRGEAGDFRISAPIGADEGAVAVHELS